MIEKEMEKVNMNDFESYPHNYQTDRKEKARLSSEEIYEMLMELKDAYAEMERGISVIKTIITKKKQIYSQNKIPQSVCEVDYRIEELENQIDQVFNLGMSELERLGKYTTQMNCVYAPPQFL